MYKDNYCVQSDRKTIIKSVMTALIVMERLALILSASLHLRASHLPQ